MPNLIDSLGVDYCNSRMAGAMFFKDGEPHLFEQVGVDPKGNYSVYAARYAGTPEKIKSSRVVVPNEWFADWAALSYHTLGYRQAANGQVLCYVGRNNSVNRGLHLRDVTIEMHPVSYEVSRISGLNLNGFTGGGSAVNMIMKPAFTPLLEGVAAVLAGKMPAFAVSPNFAVAPSADVPFLEILYRQRRVGTVDEKGRIDMAVPSIRALWERTNEESKK